MTSCNPPSLAQCTSASLIQTINKFEFNGKWHSCKLMVLKVTMTISIVLNEKTTVGFAKSLFFTKRNNKNSKALSSYLLYKNITTRCFIIE